MSDLIGSVIGPYQITEKLGRGGMADVYKAWHRELEIHRAIKVIRPEFVTTDDFRARFQKEAQGLARLRHPNIVQIHDFGLHDSGNDDRHFYMVMEFLEGSTLKSTLVRDGRLPIARAITITRDVATALGYAHERDLIHRDIKPDNIMLTTEGRPVLMDFGIAKLLSVDSGLTQTGTGIGTPAYMAPEQAKGLPVGPATDIYALGIVLFEMLTGRVPYDADTPIAVMMKAISDPMPMPRSLNPEISEALQGVILKATAKDPLARYQNVHELVSSLDACEKPQARTAMLPPPPAAAGSIPVGTEPVQTAKSRTPLVISGMALIALVIAGGWYIGSNRDNPVSTPVAATESAGSSSRTEEPVTSGSTIDAATGGDSILHTVDREFAAAETQDIALDLTEGETVFLNIIETTAVTDFILKSPGGRAEVFNTYRTDGPFTIRHTGRHVLTIQQRDPAGRARAELIRLTEPEIYGGSIYPSDKVTGVTRLPGQTILRHIELAADSTVYLHVMRSSTTADFSLTAPDERTRVFDSYRDAGPLQVPQSGVYSLRIDPRDGALADFEAAIYVVDPPDVDLGVSTADTLYSDRTTLPGQTLRRHYQFNAGDNVFLHVARSDVTTDFSLIAPGGARVIENYRSAGPIQIPVSGEYELLADPRDAALADHDVRMVMVNPLEIDSGVLAAGTLKRGMTLLPGQSVSHSIQLKKGDLVGFENINASVIFDFRLLTGDRTQTLFDTYNTAADVSIPATGVYLLIADPRDDGVGSFEFRLTVKDGAP